AGRQVTHRLGLPGAFADLGHGNALERGLQRREYVGVLRAHHRVDVAAQALLAAAAGGDDADADLDEADVALVRGDRLPAGHRQVGAAAQSQAVYGGDDRLRRVAQAEGSLL